MTPLVAPQTVPDDGTARADRPSAIVTGAASGFGRLIADTLARHGYTVYAGMRDPAGRHAAIAAAFAAVTSGHGGRVHPIALDVTDDASVDAAVAEVLASSGRIDVLVNNAGVMYSGITEAYTLAQVQTQWETNVLGPLRLDRAVLPTMRAAGRGLLVHVTSLAGGLVFPFFTHYSATKAACEALAEGLAYELAPLGIDVAIVQPGPFPTGLLGSQVEPADAGRAAAYGALAAIPAAMRAGTEALVRGPDAQDPQAVADVVAALAAMAPGTRPLRTIPGTIDFGLTALNAVRAEAQYTLLTAWGLTHLVPRRREAP